MLSRLILIGLLAPIVCSQCLGQESIGLHQYAAKEVDGAKLTHANGVPVLLLQGSPASMGKQAALLTKSELMHMHTVSEQLIERANMQIGWKLAKTLAQGMAKQFPEDHKLEMDSLAQHSGIPVELLYSGHFIVDVTNGLGCSDLVVEPSRSKSDTLLFGRNMDFNPVAFPTYCIVVVRKPDGGKHAFASVAYPGLLGVSGGMNVKGLCVAHNSIRASGDGAKGFSSNGQCTLLLCRRILEECSTVEEAVDLVKMTPSAGRCALIVADTQRGVVIEITTKSTQVRPSEKGIAVLTNHLRCEGLVAKSHLTCKRWDEMQAAVTQTQQFDKDLICGTLDRANQGPSTLHSLVFEPATFTMHLAIGNGEQSATQSKYREVKLEQYLRR